MQPPKVIFLDAVGTLFGVRGTVGALYAQQAARFGVSVDSLVLDQAFVRVFRDAPPAAFPGVSRAELEGLELEWWKKIAAQVFEVAGAISEFPDFDHFFINLYHYFSTSEPWIVYEDVLPMLRFWKQQGIELGIISNFDTRLYSVLEALQLAPFFSSVTISTEVGVAKPNPEIFTVALRQYPYDAALAWHIGDSFGEDYQGAKAAGLQGIYLQRESTALYVRKPGSKEAEISYKEAWTSFRDFKVESA